MHQTLLETLIAEMDEFAPQVERLISPHYQLFDEGLRHVYWCLRRIDSWHDKLARNTTTYLVHTVLNHIVSSVQLLRSGLQLEAAACLRLAWETVDLVEFLNHDKNAMEEWANGKKKFLPRQVREELPGTRLRAQNYAFLCDFVHPKLASWDTIMQNTGQNSYQLMIGCHLHRKNTLWVFGHTLQLLGTLVNLFASWEASSGNEVNRVGIHKYSDKVIACINSIMQSDECDTS